MGQYNFKTRKSRNKINMCRGGVRWQRHMKKRTAKLARMWKGEDMPPYNKLDNPRKKRNLWEAS